MREYNELQKYFKSVQDLFVLEQVLLKESEEKGLRCYYEQINNLWVNEPSLSEQLQSSLLHADDYRSYSSQVGRLFQNDYGHGSEINVWAISGLKHDEVRNTAVLAWWFDKSESHGLGCQLLRQIITDHIDTKGDATKSACEHKPYQVRCESLPLSEFENRIDIEIVSDDFLMFWEVKINAPEGKRGQQLAEYRKLLTRKADTIVANQQSYLIYLTKKKSAIGSDVCSLTWSEVRESFLTVYYELMSKQVGNFTTKLLYQYCQFIERFK